MPQPIPSHPLVTFDGSSGKACVVERSGRHLRLRDTVTVTCLRGRGDTLWTRSLAYAPRAVSSHVRDSVRNKLFRSLRPRFSTAEIDRALHIPESLPPVTDAIAGSDGTLWLRGLETGGDVTYTIISRDGSSTTLLTMNRRLRVLAASERSVWCEERDDDDDVPSLGLFSLRFVS